MSVKTQDNYFSIDDYFFLKMGTTFASFHTVGNKPFTKEMLKNLDRDDAMPIAHIFNREFPITSTPQAFDTSTLFN